jgi:hypothetical protein
MNRQSETNPVGFGAVVGPNDFQRGHCDGAEYGISHAAGKNISHLEFQISNLRSALNDW